LLADLRGAGLVTSFWLGPGSADATFTEHAPASIKAAPAVWGDVFCLLWQEIAYNSASAPTPENDEPLPSLHGTLTAAATHAALARIAGEGAAAPADGLHFRPAVYRLGPDGTLAPVH
jgi:hypothetical protein